MMKHLSTVRVRLTLWYMGLLGATLVASGAVLYVSLAGTLDLGSPVSLLMMHAPTGQAPSTAPEDQLRATVAHLLGGLLLLIPLILVLAVAGGLFLAGRALDPIDRITRTAERIGAEGDLHRRLDVPHTTDELGRLAATLNGMFARVESAFERERQLTTDIAHELRTPLAAIIIQSEVALQKRQSGKIIAGP